MSKNVQFIAALALIGAILGAFAFGAYVLCGIALVAFLVLAVHITRDDEQNGSGS
jgi:hypothetical protein